MQQEPSDPIHDRINQHAGLARPKAHPWAWRAQTTSRTVSATALLIAASLTANSLASPMHSHAVSVAAPVAAFVAVTTAAATTSSSSETYSRAAQSATSDSLVNLIADRLLRGDEASRERTLIALRRLRDPKLRPLFAEFSSSADPVLRLHGIMGLAELEPDRPVDTLLIRRIEDRSQVAAVLGRALRDNRLSPDDLSDIARWPDLDPSLRVIILGRLDRLGRTVPAATYRAEITDDRPLASLLAAMHLINRGDATENDRKPIDNLLRPITPETSAQQASEQRVLLSSALDLIRGEQLAGCAAFVESVFRQTPPADSTARREALWTLAIAAPHAPNTVALWKSEAGRADLSRADRLRLALAAADAAARIGASDNPNPNPVCSIFAADQNDPVAAALGRAGIAATAAPYSLEQDAQALNELLAGGYAPGFTWAIGWARSLEFKTPRASANSGDIAQPLSLARSNNAWQIILRHAIDARRTEPASLDWIMDAATSLSDSDPSFVAPHLAAAVERRDGPLAEAILAGALRSINPATVGLTAAFIGQSANQRAAELSPVATGLASLIAARHATDRDPERMQAMAELALADGRSSSTPALPTVFRVQAAWLALRAGGREREAMARLLDASRPVANVPSTERGGG